MAEFNTPASNNDSKNAFKRPTSLTVNQSTSPSPAGVAIKTDYIKTPSPSKNQSSSTIIPIPPSPSQLKISSTSPTSLETSNTSANAAPTNSVSFLEMASSFFRWGSKSNNSATAPPLQSEAAAKQEASPKSTTGDIEGNNIEHAKSNKTSLDRVSQPPVINVITNPNENLKLNILPGQCNASAASGKQRTSRKTMRAPQPPITGTPKVDSKLPSQMPSQSTSPSDAAYVQENTEAKLLKLLSDFNSGKVC